MVKFKENVENHLHNLVKSKLNRITKPKHIFRFVFTWTFLELSGSLSVLCPKRYFREKPDPKGKSQMTCFAFWGSAKRSFYKSE